ncbi:glycoside hydrolase family 5 protein [Backusella circina FSU 941]|nr:glycoside hydrolase family 5 protein [Backusella circina FSU 941]
MVFWKSIITAGLGLLAIASHASPIAEKRNGTGFNFWTTKAWGTNLGNWLILEKWMDSTIFDTYAPNATDEWSFCQQASNPEAALTNHWNSFVNESDFKMLASVGVNLVRVPVGYWAFIKPASGEPYVSTGQKAQIERILGYCEKYGMYAVIDLHGLPGSQNGNDHSGHGNGVIDFYTNYNVQRGLNTIQAIVKWMNGLDPNLKKRIASIQSANEPTVSAKTLPILKKYYKDAYNIINNSAFKVPMMFHDAFQGLDAWNGVFSDSANAVIDYHSYFTDSSDASSLLGDICNLKSAVSGYYLPVFFGEWSLATGVASSASWLRQLMDTQVSVYKNAGVGGTFWALKNKINSDVWSFEQLIGEGYINNGTFSLYTNAKC